MKGYIYNILHRCESITDWTTLTANIAVDADEVEGVYSLKVSATANDGQCTYGYGAGYIRDFTNFTHILFYAKSGTGLLIENATFWLVDNIGSKLNWFFDPPVAWGLQTLDLSAPDGESLENGSFDFSNVSEIKIKIALNGDSVLFDYILGRVDVESKIANCYIWSPMYKNVAGFRSIRPLGWDPNVPYTNWDKRFQLCRIRIKPTYESYFIEGDIIEIQDDNSVCCFYGRIVKKFDRTTSYIIDAWGWGDELMESIFANAYTASEFSTMLEGQIDASSKSTYTATSIDGTTIKPDYDVKIPTYSFIDLIRYAERSVFYRVPGYDGKCYFDKDITDVNLLPLATLIFPATYDFRDDTVGAEPSGWTSNNGADCTTLIKASLDGHKNVLELYDNNAAGYADIYKDYGDPIADSVWEVYIAKSSVAADTTLLLYIRETTTILIQLAFTVNDLRYYDGDWHDLEMDFMSADTFYHIKIICDDTANTFDCYINEVLEGADLPYENNSTTGGDRFWLRSDTADVDYSVYIDALGSPTYDSNYTVGQNLAQFSESHYCKGVRFIGKKSYNLGVTRAHVWGTVNSKEQVNKISSLTTEEQEKGSFPIFPYIDLSLTNYTEVNQLATALKNIFSTDTLFINWRVRGIGFMQWGYRIRARWNIKSSLPTADDYMITEYIYDAKNDRYLRLILSNNIVFEREFVNIQKQLGRDIVVNASMMDSQASESTANGTVLRQRVLPLLIARAPITHIVAGAPDVNYDSADGVEIGDLYIDTTNTKAYICLSNTAGAADWNQID